MACADRCPLSGTVVDLYVADKIFAHIYDTESEDVAEVVSGYVFAVHYVDRRKCVYDCVDDYNNG